MEEQGGSWDRSFDKNVDMLHILMTGELHDCSFKIGKAPQQKVFKCHKLILSVVSSVFQVMFYGNFAEANKDRDDPINLDYCDPVTFEAALRFIYGNRKEFRDAALALKVFNFAHKLQIPSLECAVNEFLSDNNLESLNVLAVFDAFRQNDDSTVLILRCKDVLFEDTKAALASDSWLQVSEDTVGAVLQMEEVSIYEVDLFKALIRWGKAQVEKDNDGSPLRTKVEGLLKFIRFESLDSKSAAEVCKATGIFTVEEQNAILLTAARGDMDDLPQEWAVVEKRSARKSCIRICLKYTLSGNDLVSPNTVIFVFNVLRKVKLFAFALQADYQSPIENGLIGLFNFQTRQKVAAFALAAKNSYQAMDKKKALTPGVQYCLAYTNWGDIGSRCWGRYTLTPPLVSSNVRASIVTQLGNGNTYLPVSDMHLLYSV